MPVGGDRIVIFPVHLELAVRVFMIALIRLPPQRHHHIADLAITS
jgi:hypothetical protein